MIFYRRYTLRDEFSWAGSGDVILGYGASEMPLTLSAWHSLIHIDDQDAALRAMTRLASDRTVMRVQYRIRLKDGGYRYIVDEAAFVDDATIVGAVRLIDPPEKHAELELIRFFELSLDLFCIARLDGFFVRVNANFTRILGHSDEELTTRPFLDFVHPDDRPATVDEMSKLSSGLPVVQFRNRYSDVRGDYHWLEWTARSVPTEGVIYAVARDVTEARLAEAQRIARVGSWEWRIPTNQVWWSDEYYRLLGLRRNEVPACVETFNARLHPDDRAVVDQWAATALATGAPKSFEFRIIRPDGMERVFWTEARLENDADGKPYRLLGTCQDITERRRALEERRHFEQKLLEAQKLESLGVLAGGIAHDFNNLLAAILGNASMISLKMPADSPQRPCLANILQASERAAALCRQMLAYSGRGRFVVANLDLNTSIREMTDLFKLSISKKVELQVHLAEKLPPVLADATQIGQVVMNLVINAAEAVGDRPGKIRITTGVRHVDQSVEPDIGSAYDLPDGPYVVFEVTDTGCGMDDDTRRKIFEPFFTTKFTGRGLGLAAVLGIVRGHKGSIAVDSQPGVGSTFRLHLPASPGVVETAVPLKTSTEPWKGEGVVLVVDDDRLVCETAARMLHSLGYRVVEACDGEEALARFRESPDAFRFVLLDLTMPKLDGEEVFHTLNALRPRLPVILMSGFSEQEASGRFAGAGLAGFLAKPFTFQGLVASLRHALDGHSV